jgi:hypothetical protein
MILSRIGGRQYHDNKPVLPACFSKLPEAEGDGDSKATEQQKSRS